MSQTIDLSESPRRPAWWLPFLIWTGVVVLYAMVLWQQIGLPLRWALEGSAVHIYSLALLTIPGRRWSWRDMTARRPAPLRVLWHVAIGVATIAVWFGVNMLYQRIVVGPQFWQIVYKGSWLFQILFSVTMYGMALGITIAAQSWRHEQERARREAALALVTRDAELGAIRAQFQPHFVLNALNSLLALIDRDPALARTMVVRLADVMKAVFDRIDLPAVPLARELDLVEAYLDVERIRFGARLNVTVDADAAARSVMVPPFLLQPIVENAVKHGIAPYAEPGHLAIVARLDGRRLRVEVRDTGSGSANAPAATAIGTGRGLSITRRRLEALYGTDHELTLDHTTGGTSARIIIPAEIGGASAS